MLPNTFVSNVTVSFINELKLREKCDSKYKEGSITSFTKGSEQ